MKKLLKKIKAKHLARVGLVMMLMLGVLLMLCSFTYPLTVTIDKSYRPNCLYSINGENITGDSYVDNVYTETFSEFPVVDDYELNLLKIEGDRSYITDVYGTVVEEFEQFDDVGLEDGYYKVLFMVSRLGNADEPADFVVDGVSSGYSTLSDGIDNVWHYYSTDSIEGSSVNFKSVDASWDFNPILVQCVILTPVVPESPPGPEDSLTDVWSSILTWITSAINSVVGIFWTGSQLTLIGTLALVGTAIALCLLIYNKVKDFIKLQ